MSGAPGYFESFEDFHYGRDMSSYCDDDPGGWEDRGPLSAINQLADPYLFFEDYGWNLWDDALKYYLDKVEPRFRDDCSRDIFRRPGYPKDWEWRRYAVWGREWVRAERPVDRGYWWAPCENKHCAEWLYLKPDTSLGDSPWVAHHEPTVTKLRQKQHFAKLRLNRMLAGNSAKDASIPAQAVTIETALKSMGYASGHLPHLHALDNLKLWCKKCHDEWHEV